MNNEEKILLILEQMQADMSVMKTDVSELKQRQAALEARMDRSDQRQQAILDSQLKTEHEIWPRVSASIDGVLAALEKNTEQDGRISVLEIKSEDHGNRISALEYLAKAE